MKLDDLKNYLSSLERVEDCLEANSSVGKQSGTWNGTNTASQSSEGESQTDTLTTPQSSETLENSLKEDLRKPMLGMLTYSAQASHDHASHFPSQENNEETTTPETCGQIPYEPFARYDLSTSSWRTCLGCFQELIVTSEEYLETWPKAVITLGMTAYRRVSLARRTKGTGSGSSLWSTPIKSDAAGCVQSEKALKAGWKPRLGEQVWGTPRNCSSMSAEINESRANHKFPNLETQVAQTFWRTPASSDGEGGVMEMREGKSGHYKLRDHVQEINSHMWPTPRAGNPGSRKLGTGGKVLSEEAAKWPTPSANPPGWKHIEVVDKNGNPPEHFNQRIYDKETGRLVQKGLEQVVSWPTPTTRDWKDSGQAVAEGRVPVNALLGRDGVTNGGHAGLASSSAMREKLKEHGEEGKKMATQALNPDWVAWLMGWPISWDNVDSDCDIEFWLASQAYWWLADPADVGFIPRVTPQKKNRVNRLKALGNGQVPQCMAFAWLVLQPENWVENRIVREVVVERPAIVESGVQQEFDF